jgi:hypothetical protein
MSKPVCGNNFPTPTMRCPPPRGATHRFRIRDDGPVRRFSATARRVSLPACKTGRNFPTTSPSPTPSSNTERLSSRCPMRRPRPNLPTGRRLRHHLPIGKNSSQRSSWIPSSTSATAERVESLSGQTSLGCVIDITTRWPASDPSSSGCMWVLASYSACCATRIDRHV